MFKYIILLIFIPISVFSQNNQIQLFANNKSQFGISTNNKIIENKVADIIANNFYLLTNYRLPILKSKLTSNNIIINKIIKIGDDEYLRIRTDNSDIFIEGTNDEYLEYAAYTFLENYLGIHFYIPEEKFIPKKAEIYINKNLDIKEIPDFKHRQYWFFGSLVPSEEFLKWNKLHSYKTDTDFGMYMVHNIEEFIPDNLIYKYPEFFAFKNNKRVTDQLDFTNDKLSKYFIERVKVWIKNNPNLNTIPINPKDNELYCNCLKCETTSNRYGSKMAAFLYLINKVAKEFPNKKFIIQAYKSNRKPPVNFKLQHNIYFVISDIEINRLKGVQNDISNNALRFKEDLSDWNKLTPNILIWDYITWHDSSFIPFPTIKPLAENLRYFIKKSQGMFLEGDGGIVAFQHKLKPYLAAKLMWDTNKDADEIIKEFYQFYYGDASDIMFNYYSLIDKNLVKYKNIDTNGSENFYKDAASKYLSSKNISDYKKIIANAKIIVKNNKKILDRIEVEEIGLLIVELEISKYVNKTKPDNKKVNKLKQKLENMQLGTYNTYLQSFDLFFSELN